MTHVILLLGGSLVVSIIVKVTVIAVLGLIGAWLGRRSRAAVRHAMLAACFAALVALPVASFLIPPVHVAVVQERVVQSRLPDAIDTTQFGAPTNTRAGVASSVSRWSVPPLDDLLFAGWIAGTLLFLMRIIVGLRQVHVLRRFGLPWRDGQIVVKRIAVDAGIHRHVEVLLHESLAAPVTCGVFHPAIVLPPDAQNWDGEDLGRAILHELEHVRRWDWVSQCLARAVCAAYWFHPLVWIAWRQLALEAERCCDDLVFQRSDATAYADQLVELAQRLSRGGKSPALAMANRSDLSSRVRAVLDSRRQRGRAGAFLVSAVCGVAALVVLAMSPLRMVAGQSHVAPAPMPPVQMAQVQEPPVSHEPKSEPATTAKFDVASIKPCKDGSEGASRGGGGSLSLGRLNRECQTVMTFIKMAYVVFANGRVDLASSTPIEGGPGWINSDRYTIDAKADGTPNEAMMSGPMLQGLLEERFKLKIRREVRKVPVYELTVAKGGSKLQPFKEGSCIPFDLARYPPVLPGPGQEFCNGRQTKKGLNRVVEEQGMTFGDFCKIELGHLDRPVVDKTGITGRFDFHLEYSIDGIPSPDEPITAPSIFTAVQEQLGLKLVPTQGPSEFLVIDHVERPSEN
jgi:uncharacterized protein (TIGR03435 family)